jgi:nucleoprotein TPR
MADGGVLAISLPEDVDHDALTTLLPGLDPNALTVEAAVHVFRLLLAQALELDDKQRELDDARAELERKDVELEQAYQDRESATQTLENTVDALQTELTHVKTERDMLRQFL